MCWCLDALASSEFVVKYLTSATRRGRGGGKDLVAMPYWLLLLTSYVSLPTCTAAADALMLYWQCKVLVEESGGVHDGLPTG